VKLPVVLPESRWQKDVTFATIPGTNRNLLCDVWQPPDNVTPTGLAFIYLHGSAFYLLDKDFGTRTLFRYLAAQGHVVMDVAYRLWPETDVMGMVHDVKRAIAWMKNNASTYNVSTDRIVLGGGSAGGHLALLAAYTNNKPGFAPEELLGQDTSVCAVASFYGSNDMEAIYYHTNQHLTTRGVPGKLSKKVPTGIPHWITKRMGDDYHRLGFDKDFEKTGTLAPLLGGHPDERPETYRRFSAITHVEAGCPPTYLIHGDHDIMAPVTSTRALFAKLVKQNVPAVLHILPQTEHGFDLVLPAISPPAHTQFYEIERFLALHASKSIVKPREAAREAASLDKE
jgi:acetyl esterase/lipase